MRIGSFMVSIARTCMGLVCERSMTRLSVSK